MIYLKDASGSGYTPVSTTNPIPVTFASGSAQTFAGFTSTSTGVFTSAATAGLQIYNTSDQTTNYERLQLLFSGNVGYISLAKGGSGTRRQIQFIAGDGIGSGNNSGILISALTTFPAVSIFARLQSMADANFTVLSVGGGGATYAGTSGTNSILSIIPTYNQASGTAANTDLVVTRTETAVGSGAQNLAIFGTTALGDMWKVSNRGKMTMYATNTAGGTTGNQTIDKPTGTVNFAAAATTLTVTNSLCSTASIVFAVIRTNDGTATLKNVVPGAGSFVITLTAAATAETSVGFMVIN